MKRAAIYIRVSSESQAGPEKVSPDTQLSDCEKLCKAEGYSVVSIYKDTKRYRSGGKIVQPSATRNDRPEFNKMLKDADDGKFDVLIAWREDRLYRGVNRSMLEISERVTKNIIDVKLVKEHYDASTAPVKAWAAGVELEAKRDRFLMGVEGRLKKGKIWTTTPAFGYKRDENGDYLEIYEPEAKWVRNCFEWYANGISVKEIRQRFIDGGAPSKKPDKVKRPWSKARFYKILWFEPYWTGINKVNWNGKKFEIPIEPIVSQELANICIERRKRYRCYPAGNAKHPGLASGIVYCKACGVRMISTNVKNGRTLDRNGKLKLYPFYTCNMLGKYDDTQGCAKKTSANKLDTQIWDKVWSLISQPGIFEEALLVRLDELKSREIDAEDEYKKLGRMLDDVLMERQMVIGWARKKAITEEDMETQLLGLTLQQNEIERQIAEVNLLLGNQSERLEELGSKFREKVITGLDEINKDLGDPELKKKQFEFKKKIVEAIVERVDVLVDKTPIVHFVIDIDQLSSGESMYSINTQSSSSSIRSKPHSGR